MANPFIERMLPWDTVTGADYNRIVDALGNNRQSSTINTLQTYDICFGYQAVDPNTRSVCRFYVPTSVYKIVHIDLFFTLQPFAFGAQATSGGATTSAESATHTHGEGSHTHPHSHGSHAHTLPMDGGNSATGNVSFNGAGSNLSYNLGATNTALINGATPSTDSTAGAGAGTGTESVTHTHTIAGLTLLAPSALAFSGMAQGVHVFIDSSGGTGGTDVTTALGGPFGFGVTLDSSVLVLDTYITTTGWHEVSLSSGALGGIIPTLHFDLLNNSSI